VYSVKKPKSLEEVWQGAAVLISDALRKLDEGITRPRFMATYSYARFERKTKERRKTKNDFFFSFFFVFLLFLCLSFSDVFNFLCANSDGEEMYSRFSALLKKYVSEQVEVGRPMPGSKSDQTSRSMLVRGSLSHLQLFR
jgi:hypothetical protein